MPILGCCLLVALLLYGCVAGLRSCANKRHRAAQPERAAAQGGEPQRRAEPDLLVPTADQYAASPVIKNVRVVIEPADGSAPAKGTAELRADTGARLDLLVQCGAPGDPDANVYYSAARDAYWGPARLPPGRIGPWRDRDFGPLNIRWYKIEPERDNYTNWRNNEFSFTRINYVKPPVLAWANEWSVDADVSSTTYEDRLPGYGTMRYCVEVFRTDPEGVREKSVFSVGPESAATASGIGVSAPRLSLRRDDTYIGWLFAWGNVPYIWGSESPKKDPALHQAELFQGADCADLLTAAARKLGLKDLPYGNTFDIPKHGRVVFRDIEPGPDGVYTSKDQPVPWGDAGVLAGDVIVYGEHSAALVSDGSGEGNGELDLGDTVLHTLNAAPSLSTVGDAWDTHTITVVRWPLNMEP